MQYLSRSIQLLWLLILINTRAALALRGAFLLRSFFMFLNNLLFFITWIILFTKVDHIGGWHLQDCALLYGLVAFGIGIYAVCFGGVSNLSRMIAEGELDTFLSQPKSVLLSAVASKTNVAGWGDIVSGALLIIWSGYASPENIVLVFICSISTMILFTMTGIIAHSLAFWLGSIDSLAMQMHEFVIAFSLYPGVIFKGMLRVMLFTIIPAGFISYLPVELIRSFSWSEAGLLLLGVVTYTLLGLLIFSAGLRRYESGNKVIVRA